MVLAIAAVFIGTHDDAAEFFRREQLKNISLISVTIAVLKLLISRVVSFEQPLNIPFK